jgi:hypothetical protein
LFIVPVHPCPSSLHLRCLPAEHLSPLWSLHHQQCLASLPLRNFKAQIRQLPGNISWFPGYLSLGPHSVHIPSYHTLWLSCIGTVCPTRQEQLRTEGHCTEPSPSCHLIPRRQSVPMTSPSSQHSPWSGDVAQGCSMCFPHTRPWISAPYLHPEKTRLLSFCPSVTPFGPHKLREERKKMWPTKGHIARWQSFLSQQFHRSPMSQLWDTPL